VIGVVRLSSVFQGISYETFLLNKKLYRDPAAHDGVACPDVLLETLVEWSL
jgi:hypothetical protein